MHDCQILLPPEVLLDLGTHRGEHVVAVHHNVDERVEQAKEARVSSGSELNAPPDRRGHNSMVDDVQRGHLVVSLAHHEEERVEELGELGEEIPPTSGRHSQSLRAVPVHGLASQTVASHPSAHARLIEDPRAEGDLDGIVNDEHAAQLEGLSVLHQLGPDNL